MPKIFSSSVARSTPFDNTTNGFASDDVQSAIEEVTSTGIGLPPDLIPSNTIYTIPVNKQLVLAGGIRILGTLHILGRLGIV